MLFFGIQGSLIVCPKILAPVNDVPPASSTRFKGRCNSGLRINDRSDYDQFRKSLCMASNLLLARGNNQ